MPDCDNCIYKNHCELTAEEAEYLSNDCCVKEEDEEDGSN